MNKKHFAVIGHPIGHTMSPFIHKRLFELSGVDAEYDILNISPTNLSTAYSSLKELDGYNITLPHKRTILPFLDSLSRKANLYGSVNTVKNEESSKGYTTDPDGFLRALEHAQIPLQGKVVILGTGGVARVMAYESALAGCDTVIAVRPSDLSAAASLAGEILTRVIAPQIKTCTIESIEGPIDLLVNATPVGMYPKVHETPVPSDIVAQCEAVFDAVYNPMETLLQKTARSLGAKTVGGISMLVWQAVVSHEVWDGSLYSKKDVETLCHDAVDEMKRLFPEE